MKNRLYYCLCLSFLCYQSSVFAVSDERAMILESLSLLDLEELQEVEIKLDDVFDVFGALVRDQSVSIATGEAQKSSVAPAVTSVITAQDIEAMGARTLAEALRSVPGLHVGTHWGTDSPTYAVRGVLSATNPEILVMINNVPIKALNTGGVGRGWGHLPVANIARVEVIRGPGSAVYGADAFSGVINILTKTADDMDGGEAGARVGSYNTYEGWVQYGKKFGNVDLAASVEYINSDGFNGIVESDAQSFFDQQYGTSASNAPTEVDNRKDNIDVNLDAGYQDWRLHALYQSRELGYNAIGLIESPKTGGTFNDRRLLLSLSRQWQLNDNWDLQGLVSYYHRDFDSGIVTAFPAGAFNGRDPDGMHYGYGVEQVNTRAEFSAFYHGFATHSVRLGAGYVYEDLQHYSSKKDFGYDAQGNLLPIDSPIIDFTGTSASALDPAVRRNKFIYVQDTWNFATNWDLTTGLRYDDYSDFGSTINPRFALVHQISETLTGKLLYGRAFRSPSLDELALKNSGALLGNINIQPEKIETWEIAFVYRPNDVLNLNTNLFTYRVSDKIIRVPEDVSGLQIERYQNAGEQTGKGLEMELRWKINVKTSLLANYAYVDTEDEHGDSVPRVPHQTAYLRADHLLGNNWFIDTQLNWIAQFKRIAVDPRPATSNYTTVDLSLRYKGLSSGAWDFAVGVRNLFDADVYESMPYTPGTANYFEHDMPTAEREWFSEIRYRF